MAAASQPNGIPSSSAGPSHSQTATQSQPTQNTTTSGTTTIPNTQSTIPPSAGGPPSPTSHSAPRPRDARTMELLLTSQGVTSFDQRVPLVLMDFAYRHTSSILNDALHLSGDPYTTQAGAKPSGSSGAVPQAPPGGDATVTNNALSIAISSRQYYQFRGGAGGSGTGGVGGGGVSKEWLQDVARARNRQALPRVLANEWGVRLPNERFVLSGQSWGLKDDLPAAESSDEENDIEMEGVESTANKPSDEKKDGEEGGLEEFIDDDFGDDEMEGME
ncbi:transcription initiation factor IID, 31kD subunit-domain-containing protein [Xylariaceae sp. FL1019]|nr:transcription initiation factor IID, 31kD subunit-domain-containing protein [Xylariaceae sp. FL1019]